MTEVRWANSPDFAEVAEAIGVNTDRVLAARQTGDEWWVLYTPHYDDGDDTIWSALLQRNSDGILVLASVPRSHPGMYEELERNLEEALKEKFGDPDE